MSNVEFDEDESLNFQIREKSGKIIKILISLHLARNVREASSILLIVSIIAIVATVFLILSLNGSESEEIYDPYVEGGPAILE